MADRPSCLILDLRLRGPSGLDLQAELGGKQQSIPIIFITGHGTVPASVRAMKGGALDFLEKPFDDGELLESVQRALARSRDAHTEHAERDAIQHRLETLTPRERQVMGLVVRGMLNKQIAADLGAAEKTIKIHRGRVMKKMQADRWPTWCAWLSGSDSKNRGSDSGRWRSRRGHGSGGELGRRGRAGMARLSP